MFHVVGVEKDIQMTETKKSARKKWIFASCAIGATILTIAILCTTLLQGTTNTKNKMSSYPNVQDYWSDLNGDLTKVTWSHATNSQQKLAEALSESSKVMMMEADVSLGWLTGQIPEAHPKIPIMAHPPAVLSDLSLEEFLNKTIEATQAGVKKGIKLDFKSTDVASEGLAMVEKYADQFNFPVWSNADIAIGPSNAQSPTVDPDKFLSYNNKSLPEATLSLGFTTSTDIDTHDFKYSWEQVETMVDALRRNGVLDKTSGGLTFALRGIFLYNSIEQIMGLLDQTSSPNVKSTVTIWGKDNLTDYQLDGLKEFVATVGRDRCFTDTTADI